MSGQESQSRIRAASVCRPLSKSAWTFSVSPGEAVWISADRDLRIPWLDWLTGIQPPPCGEIYWEGVEWRERGPTEASEARGEMGCVFETGGMLVNLNMDENVWLPARIHQRENAAESIEHWARLFKCWPLPGKRASQVGERERRRILWVRAFAGNPKALILEQPQHDMPAADRELFLDAVRRVRADGCAVVWLDESLAPATEAALAPLIRVDPVEQ